MKDRKKGEHRCNLLCGDGVHVDLIWTPPHGTETVISAKWQRVYGVDVVEVRRVEPCPPKPGEEVVALPGRNTPMEQWPGIVSWGVWWRSRKYQPLAVRQRQVLTCRCVDGLTNAETGKRLGISGHTVKNLTTPILEKLGVQTMQEACFRFGRMLGPDEKA